MFMAVLSSLSNTLAGDCDGRSLSLKTGESARLVSENLAIFAARNAVLGCGMYPNGHLSTENPIKTQENLKKPTFAD